MITVRELKEMLSSCNDDAIVTVNIWPKNSLAELESTTVDSEHARKIYDAVKEYDITGMSITHNDRGLSDSESINLECNDDPIPVIRP